MILEWSIIFFLLAAVLVVLVSKHWGIDKKEQPVNPLLLLQQGKDIISTYKGLSYTAEYEIQNQVVMKHDTELINLNKDRYSSKLSYHVNVTQRTDLSFEPSARYTKTVRKHQLVTNGKRFPFERSSLSYEEYELGSIRFVKHNEGNVEITDDIGISILRYIIINEIILDKNINDIKVEKVGDKYQFLFVNEYFKNRPWIFDIYKQYYSYQLITDPIAQKIMEDANVIPQYDKSIFKSPIFKIVIDAKSTEILQFDIHSYFKVPVLSDQNTDTGTDYPFVEIDELSFYTINGEFSGTIEVPTEILEKC